MNIHWKTSPIHFLRNTSLLCKREAWHNITQLLSCVHGLHSIFENKPPDVIFLVFRIEFEFRALEHNSSVKFVMRNHILICLL